MTKKTAAKQIDPMATDFRALDVLTRVYRFRSFTRAAQDLDLNQSVVSYTVDKLRDVFGDPLFVTEARQLIPTPRCETIVGEAAELLQRFSQLAARNAFDPQESRAQITIACNYYERVLIIPDVVRAISARAPNMKIEIVDSSYLGHDRLLRMEADLLLGPFTQLGASFYARTLYDDHYVCMMDHRHPMADRALTLEDYLGLKHIYITYGGKWKSRYMQEIERNGYDMDICIRTSSPAGLQNLIRGTEFVATIPERLSRKIGEDLSVMPCPVAVPVTIQMVWTSRTHGSQMHRWVRDVIVECCRAL